MTAIWQNTRKSVFKQLFEVAYYIRCYRKVVFTIETEYKWKQKFFKLWV